MSDRNTLSAPGDSATSLQFDKAESADPAAPTDVLKCGNCGADIKTYYYAIGGSSICARCKSQLAQVLEPRRGVEPFLKALAFGGVAAVLGAAIYYGVIAITGFQIGIVALLIGFLVGK